jgi:sugar phosphate permease
MQSSTFLGVMELGGVIGSISLGYLSDVCMQRYPQNSVGNGRHYIIIPCFISLWISLVILRTHVMDMTTDINIALTLAFFMGAGVYSAINILGVLSLENANDDVSGFSNAICASVGIVGQLLVGLPFSTLVENSSWDVAMQVVEAFMISAITCFVASQWFRCTMKSEKPDKSQ